MKKNLILLLFCMVALCLLGLLMLYSAAFNSLGEARLRMNAMFVAVGVGLVAFLILVDYRWLGRRAVLWAMGVMCVGMLAAVFIPGVGIESHGARRWLCGFGEPSEFAKPMVILLLAGWLARLDREKTRALVPGFLVPLALGCVPALLVLFEPDWGTAILFGLLTLTILFVNGARYAHLATTSAVLAALFTFMIGHNQMRLLRIMVFRDPEAHQHGLGWQVWQSMVAIGSGGVWGDAWNGSLHVFGYVPEERTDFIFACICEQAGLVGATLVLLLYLGMLLCGVSIMKQARDRFGYLLAAGCTTVIVLQAIINIAVATSLIPNKGLPLPFMSYGGSSMIAMFICAGLLGSVAWHSEPKREPADSSHVVTTVTA